MLAVNNLLHWSQLITEIMLFFDVGVQEANKRTARFYLDKGEIKFEMLFSFS